MKDILHIHFTNIVVLQVGESRMESIEGMDKVQMPHLRKLSLRTWKLIKHKIGSDQWQPSEKHSGPVWLISQFVSWL